MAVITKRFEISNLNNDEVIICRIIQGRKGQKNAVTADKINKITGFNVRYIRRIIKNLIEAHYFPVAASNVKPYGYYTPIKDSEILQYKSTLIHRISSLAQRLRAFDKLTAQKVERALDLFGNN